VMATAQLPKADDSSKASMKYAAAPMGT
jgi:hypothetical protein